MAASTDNPDDYVTKRDLAVALDRQSAALNRRMDQKLATKADVELLRNEVNLNRQDTTSLTRMVRAIMDYLGISEPFPPAR